MADKKEFVTKEGLKKIEVELDELKNSKRKEIAERISEAKELGDLSENAEYISAKEEQGFVEARIIELEQKLKNVELIAHKKNTTIVQIGSTIRIKSEKGEESSYTIVGSSEADPVNGLISNESPFGSAFLGHNLGDKVEVEAPGGKSQYEILSVE